MPSKNSIGIYHGANKQKLYPSVLGGTHFSKTGLAMLTFGMVSQNRIPFLLASTSNQKIKNSDFEFRFDLLFDQNNLPIFDRGFRDAESPKEFILLHLKPNVKKNRRYLFKEKNGWRQFVVANNKIPFQFEEINSGVFKVTPLSKLEKGEYCFVHQDVLNNPSFRDFVFFDFTIE